MTSIQKLLDVFELCEQVLCYLSAKDIARASRSCRGFKDVIDRSEPFQVKLYLEPQIAEVTWTLLPNSKTLVTDVVNEQHISPQDSQELPVGISNVLALHPVLRHWPESPDSNINASAGEFAGQPCQSLGMLSRAIARSKSNAYNIVLDYQDFDFAGGIRILETPNSSNLRKMFLSQPPARQVEVFICSRSKCVPRCYGHGFRTPGILPSFHVRDKQDVTFGQVVDPAKRCIARHSDQESFISRLRITDGFAVPESEMALLMGRGSVTIESDAVSDTGESDSESNGMDSDTD